MRAPPQDVHSAQRELSQTGTESILGDVRNEFFPLLKRQNRFMRFMKLGLGFDLIAHQLVGRKTRPIIIYSSNMQQEYATGAWLIRICLTIEK